jgi:glutaredoxin
MVTVYGAKSCEDTRRSRRHLRRLGIPHVYRDVDAEADARARAQELNGGRLRTPTIEIAGEVLVEPTNRALTETLVRRRAITAEEAADRRAVQNLGDLERLIRVVAAAGALLVVPVLRKVGRGGKLIIGAAAATSALTGVAGWCPAYARLRITSLGGPGDRPDEAERAVWHEALPGAD